jgi:hypothetical protein
MAIDSPIKDIKPITMPVPAGLGRKGRPGKVGKDPIRRYGPRALRRFADPKLTPDFCQPWPGFVTATTSLTEQMAYAAIAIFMDDPQEWWKPPYNGGIYWRYQQNIQGGRLMLGGQVIDYEVQYKGLIIGLRLQSSRWHVMAEHAKQVMDLFAKTNTPGLVIRDIFEQDFVGDCTGRAAVAVISRTLTTAENASPLMFGTGRQVRR